MLLDQSTINHYKERATLAHAAGLLPDRINILFETTDKYGDEWEWRLFLIWMGNQYVLVDNSFGREDEAIDCDDLQKRLDSHARTLPPLLSEKERGVLREARRENEKGKLIWSHRDASNRVLKRLASIGLLVEVDSQALPSGRNVAVGYGLPEYYHRSEGKRPKLYLPQRVPKGEAEQLLDLLRQRLAEKPALDEDDITALATMVKIAETGDES